MKTTENVSNKMGSVPMNRLVFTMGVPMILSMVLQAFYNIVDSYFVSCMTDPAVPNLGDYAVNALTLAFPIQMLIVAIGVGTGVGTNALLSRNLGEGNREKSSRISGNSIFLSCCTYAVFLLFGLLGVGVYIRSQTSDALVIELASSYLRICSVLSFGCVVYMIYEKLLQASGCTMLATIAQMSGVVVNIILDPIMIFGWFGCPAMGVDGAAYATVIGQFVSLMLGFLFHTAANRKYFDTSLRYLAPQRSIIQEIYKIGIPAIIMQALMSFMTYGVNIVLGSLSTAAVTAYGIYYKIQQFVFFAAFGMNNAMIPIISYNFGRRDKMRVDSGIRYGMLYTLVILGAGAVALQVFAHQLIGIFAVSEEARQLCIYAIRIITPGYLFAGANIAFQGILQAFGCGVQSLLLSLIRLIVVALPLAWLLTRLPNAELLVWSAFPIAEGAALVCALVLMRRVGRRVAAFLASGAEQTAAME